MRLKACIAILLFCTSTAMAQFKNDNVLYKTVDPADLCATLDQNKGYLIVDVRSPGEYADTSQSPGYNLGHLKGAVNIDIRELGKRLAELQAYKDKPLFVYCSHSQRSRRAGKLLADSGFTRVFNINGGMTAIHYTDAKKKDCLASMVETHTSYTIISAKELAERLKSNNGKDLFVLDVRSDSAFRHISRDAKENAYAAIRGTVNIPLEELPKRLSALPGDGKQIVVTDMYGDEASRAAVLLAKNGFQKVAVLIEGIDRLIYTNKAELPGISNFYQSPVTYETLTSTEFGQYATTHSDYLLLDIRTAEEFTNQHKDSWRNIGHLKNAVNMPASVLEKTTDGPGPDKTKEIIIYSFGNGSETFAVADGLQKEGYKNLKVLVGGIFNIRWASGNIKGQSYLKDFVVDVPAINQ